MTGSSAQTEDCTLGYFEPPFNHPDPNNNTAVPYLRAVHMALIPKGTYRGQVLVWDYGEVVMPSGKSKDTTRWAIIDVDRPNKTFNTFVLNLGANNGDLGCAGHSWTKSGRLFVAGGTTFSFGTVGLVGARLAYLFDPGVTTLGNAMWIGQNKSLERRRWYPSVTLIASDQLLVTGGDINDSVNYANTYEAFNPPTNGNQGTFEKRNNSQLFLGPQIQNATLGVYPRMHLLSNGYMFMAGMQQQSVRIRHEVAPQTWFAMGDAGGTRNYCSSVIFPNIDPTHTNAVMAIGGSTTQDHTGALHNVQMCKATRTNAACWPSGYFWTDWSRADQNPPPPACNEELTALNQPRAYPNAVLAPDASIFVFGGRNTTAHVLPVERYKGGVWTELASSDSWRGWHGTTLLLPSGKILLAGADHRQWDYQIYVPPYLACQAPRPTITSAPSAISYGGTSFTVTYTLAAGASVDKVVLMRPGSVTHSFDFDQRYLELEIVGIASGAVEVLPPAGRPGASSDPDFSTGPPGFYMLFLVTNAGVPSVASWVELK